MENFLDPDPPRQCFLDLAKKIQCTTESNTNNVYCSTTLRAHGRGRVGNPETEARETESETKKSNGTPPANESETKKQTNRKPAKRESEPTDHISRNWSSFQQPHISRSNPSLNSPYPGTDHPGPYFRELATLPETSHRATQFLIKLTTSWPRPSRSMFPGTGHSSRNLIFRYSILYQTDHILAQAIQDDISWIYIYVYQHLRRSGSHVYR